MKIRTSKTKYFPKSSTWMRAETHLQSQQKSNGSRGRCVNFSCIICGCRSTQEILWTVRLLFWKWSPFKMGIQCPLSRAPSVASPELPWLIFTCVICLHICRTWPSAPARHRTKREGRGNMKNQRASSPGSLITLMQVLMSLERSSRMISGQILCSTTWYVWHSVVTSVYIFYCCQFSHLPLPRCHL